MLYCGFVLLFYSKDGPLSLERGLQSLEQLQKKVRVLEEENAELKTVVCMNLTQLRCFSTVVCNNVITAVFMH